MLNLKSRRSTSTSSPSPDGESLAQKPAPGAIGFGTESGTAKRKIPVEAPRPAAPDEAHRPFKLRPGRFRRTVMYFWLLFARLILWEVVIRWFAGERFVGRGRAGRWRRYARRFRVLATDMGGVMIKLGQFVSSRVDVLPPEITDELAGLQDQVPIVPFDYIKSTIERELGPLEERFLWLDPEPVAAASFGQVHRGQLKNGDRIVIKVQRPNINDIVQTDLAALAVVSRMAMRYGPVRRRANVPGLLEEFSRVLWEELDYRAEADHAMIFGSMFADDPGIYVPGVYLQHSTHCVLTLEDVTSIKLTDYAAIDESGIDRKEVASRLLNCYLRQIFDHRFFHADPHPGNLFVYPLPYENGQNGSNGRKLRGRPFYLIFVDFGMVGRLTPQIIEGLRETLIAIVTQDAGKMVGSYEKLGVLMPGTDMARMEAATRAVFDKVWGLNMSELTNLRFDEVADVAKEFSDLLLAMPFQMPQDFIYLSRATGILSGMCTGLDPSFDPWHEMQPFTERLLEATATGAEVRGAGQKANGRFALPRVPAAATLDLMLRVFRDFAARAYRLPALADTVLSRAEQGDLIVQMAPDEEFQEQITRIERAIGQVVVGLIFVTLGLASTLFYINGEQTLATIGGGASLVVLLAMLRHGRV